MRNLKIKKKTSSIKKFQTVQSDKEKGHIYAKLLVQLFDLVTPLVLILHRHNEKINNKLKKAIFFWMHVINRKHYRTDQISTDFKKKKFCRKLYPFIFATRCLIPLIFQTIMN